MISRSLKAIKEKLASAEINVTLRNPSDKHADKAEIILGLINIEEETTLKNLTNQRIENQKFNKYYPKIHLNLYLMFMSVSGTTETDYEKDLKDISDIISFFQSNRIIEGKAEEGLTSPRVTMELFSPKFEELNHIVSICGGKLTPFVLFKARVIELEGQAKVDPISPIQEIQTQVDRT